jgi:hypothetical protein
MKSVVGFSVAAVVVGTCLLLLLCSPPRPINPPSYIAFSRHRKADYYSRIADACEALVSKMGAQQTNGLRLRGDDPTLPQILRDLKSKDIAVFTNRVNVFVDTEARYAVGWERDEVNPNLWRLLAYGEGEPVALLTRTNK